MSVPISQMWTVASYVVRQKLARRKRYPLVLMLEPLFRCNLACAGCGKIQYPAHVLKMQLTPEQCFKAVDECGAPMVSIPGGEPLLHPQIKEIVEGLVARRKYIYLCTNALLLKEKLDEFTPSKYLTFSVHMDGQREHHDFSVCREGGYDIAVEGIRAAVARGFRVTTNTTLFDGADPTSVRSFFDEMMDLGVEGMMLSPGYSYDKAPDQAHFLAREKTKSLFATILDQPKKQWKFNQSPLFLEFLTGTRHYACTPWGMPTYNVFGWQKPCYLLQDGYADTFAELMASTEWDRYGTESGNPKCANCMVHSGYEASAVDDTFSSVTGFLSSVRATLFGMKPPKTRAHLEATTPVATQRTATVELSVRGQRIEKAFDYRGDVTVTTKSGEAIEGYVFDRELAGAGAAAERGELRLFRKRDGQRVTVGFSDVEQIDFTGRDTAEGKSFQTWVKNYNARKAAGEKNISLEPERLE